MNELIARSKKLASQIDELAKVAKDENLSLEERQAKIDELKELKKEYEEVQREIQNKDIDGIESALHQRKQVSALPEGTNADDVATRSNASLNSNLYSTIEYRNAWTESVRKGDNGIVERFISQSSQDSAGILVPTELQNSIDDVFENNELLQRYNITEFEGLTSRPYVKSKSNPKWHKEANVDENGVTTTNEKEKKKVSFGQASLEPEYLAEVLETTKKFEALTIDAFFDWLKAELPNALLRVVLAATWTAPADGEFGCRGVLTNEDEKQVISFTKEINFNVVNAATAKLRNGLGELTVVMNRQTFYDNFLGLTDTTGAPIFKVVTENGAKATHYANGIYVDFNDEFKPYDEVEAGQPYMVVGDLKMYQINFPLGMQPEITRDAVTRKTANVIEYLSEILVGGNITAFGAFVKVLKPAAESQG